MENMEVVTTWLVCLAGDIVFVFLGNTLQSAVSLSTHVF